MNAHTRGVPSFLFDCTATVTSESRDCLPQTAVASPWALSLLEFCAHARGGVVNEVPYCGDCVPPHLWAYDDYGYSSATGGGLHRVDECG